MIYSMNILYFLYGDFMICFFQCCESDRCTLIVCLCLLYDAGMKKSCVLVVSSWLRCSSVSILIEPKKTLQHI